ncbi:unnamed protein product, partial [Nesidiocoris tenuis]
MTSTGSLHWPKFSFSLNRDPATILIPPKAFNVGFSTKIFTAKRSRQVESAHSELRSTPEPIVVFSGYSTIDTKNSHPFQGARRPVIFVSGRLVIMHEMS